MDSSLLRWTLSAIALVAYYRFAMVRIGALAGPVVAALRLEQRHPARDIDGVVRLILAGGSQALMLPVLMTIGGLDLGQLVRSPVPPSLLLFGLLLGVGEMALATFSCHILATIAVAFAPAPGSRRMEDWLVIARGGWMQLYLKTLRILPLPAALLVVLMYVTSEEVIFRGVLITGFLPAGSAAALGVSVFFFTLVQTFHTPSWRTALFPVIGAGTLGLVHGLLFLAVPNVLPLIVAHFAYFASAVTLTGAARRTTGRVSATVLLQ